MNPTHARRVRAARNGALLVLAFSALFPAGLVAGWGWAALAYVVASAVVLVVAFVLLDPSTNPQ